ncbi:craniofacial development protein 2-like [Centruroides sculpturatus]|uniref:craniofacial development protein 2-like n=1 Tax=Centruroides sculpturatus TaxID=218467 RepID=UPI000C6DD696|nr:craniofacial development protein 2-like [Centruroides sculpturatus]
MYCTLRIKARFFNITFVCVYAPTERDENDVRDALYGSLEQKLGGISKQDVKIVLLDFNAKNRKGSFRERVGKKSLHDVSNGNGKKLIDFAMGNEIVVRSRLQRRNIRKITWCSPHGTTFNQIDHVVIDSRHASDIFEVDSCREANYRQCVAIYRSGEKGKFQEDIMSIQ